MNKSEAEEFFNRPLNVIQSMYNDQANKKLKKKIKKSFDNPIDFSKETIFAICSAMNNVVRNNPGITKNQMNFLDALMNNPQMISIISNNPNAMELIQNYMGEHVKLLALNDGVIYCKSCDKINHYYKLDEINSNPQDLILGLMGILVLSKTSRHCKYCNSDNLGIWGKVFNST